MNPPAPPPDVVALPLDEALDTLREAGWQARLRESAPPRSAPVSGVRRVVRQRAVGPHEVELVVVWERYSPARRSPGGGRAASEAAGGTDP